MKVKWVVIGAVILFIGGFIVKIILPLIRDLLTLHAADRELSRAADKRRSSAERVTGNTQRLEDEQQRVRNQIGQLGDANRQAGEANRQALDGLQQRESIGDRLDVLIQQFQERRGKGTGSTG